MLSDEYKKPIINPIEVQHQVAQALRAGRAYGNYRAEVDYDAFFKALDPLDLIESQITEFEKHDSAQGLILHKDFAKATRGWSVTNILNLAAQRFERGTVDDLIHRFEKGGSVIQKLLGTLIPPDNLGEGLQARQTGENPYKVEKVDKIRKVLSALEGIRVFADDLVITRSEPPVGSLRKEPYCLITIPKFGRQIAICNEIGHATFVSNSIHPLAFWAEKSKCNLRETSGIAVVQYDREGQWINEILNFVIQGIDPHAVPKIRLVRTIDRPLLTKQKIIEWLQHTHDYWLAIDHENAGKYPSETDGEIYSLNPESGTFEVVTGEKWSALRSALSQGLRGLRPGSSLALLKKEQGFGQKHWTVEWIVQVIKDTHAHTGEWINRYTKEAYIQNKETGAYEKVKGFTGGAFDSALTKGHNGLPGGSSLASLKKEYGLGQQEVWNEEWMVQVIHDTYAHTGKWMARSTREVYALNKETGVYEELKDINGVDFDEALKKGSHGLPGGSSLAQFKEAKGLCKARLPRRKGPAPMLTEETIRDWMQATYQKLGRWPNSYDSEVYQKDPLTGKISIVPEETWHALNSSLDSGSRGLPGKKNLMTLKIEAGFIEERELTLEKVQGWIKATYEELGRPPTSKDRLVYKFNPQTGKREIASGENWNALTTALQTGARKLPGGITLPQLIVECGFKKKK